MHYLNGVQRPSANPQNLFWGERREPQTLRNFWAHVAQCYNVSENPESILDVVKDIWGKDPNEQFDLSSPVGEKRLAPLTAQGSSRFSGAYKKNTLSLIGK